MGIATFLALVAVVLGGSELLGKPVAVLQFSRETPQRWIHRGPLTWAMLNGTALGFGGVSRVGLWLWYAIPAAAFLIASPLLGLAIYGLYGTLRGMSVWAIIFTLARQRPDTWALSVLGMARLGRAVGAAVLVGIGTAVMVAVGL
jgi:hypothetical protein